MFSRHRIGTFRIARTPNAVIVHDIDKDNNWGCKYFRDAPSALAWAHWAQGMKAARISHGAPPLPFAA
jgi:hypothetical protein